MGKGNDGPDLVTLFPLPLYPLPFTPLPFYPFPFFPYLGVSEFV